MENGVNLDKSIEDVVKTKKNKKMIILILLSLLTVVCVLIAFFYIRYSYRKLVTVSFDNYKVYQYFSGIKYEYDGIATLHDYKIVNVGSDGVEVDLGESPIYFQNIDNELLLTQDVGLFFPTIKNYNYRIDRLSKIEIDLSNNDEVAYTSLNDEKYLIPSGFLFNGDNMYIFPYSASILVEDKEYKLSPLSYVIVNYKDSIEIYDHQKDDYTIIESSKDDVIATIDNYRINMSTDMIMYENNDRLLIKNVSKLAKYQGV